MTQERPTRFSSKTVKWFNDTVMLHLRNEHLLASVPAKDRIIDGQADNAINTVRLLLHWGI